MELPAPGGLGPGTSPSHPCYLTPCQERKYKTDLHRGGDGEIRKPTRHLQSSEAVVPSYLLLLSSVWSLQKLVGS